MKKLAILVLFIGIVFPKPAHAIDEDKVMHFGISFVVTGMVFGIMSQQTCIDNPDGETMSCDQRLPLSTRLITAAIVGIAMGVAKEALDSRPGGTGFDLSDMAANVAGVGTSLLVFSW